MLDLENCIAFLTNKASKILSESLNKKLLDHGVTKSQWICMYYINKEKNISQKRISDFISASEPTTTGLLKRIEDLDLIKRKVDPKDKRKNIIELTKKGKKLNKELEEIAEKFRDKCLENVSSQEQEIFLNVLDKMINSVEKF